MPYPPRSWNNRLLIGSIFTYFRETYETPDLAISIFPPRLNFSVLGYTPSETVVVGWAITAVLVIGAVFLRLFFIPRLSDTPGKLQNVIESLVATVESYASERTIHLGRPMYGFIFTIGIALIGNAVAELLGFRSPSSDLMFTLSLSALTFIIANWYGIQTQTFSGRLKSFMKPSPLLLPVKLITDLANPLSMSFRLFGNTISGMIVMNLIYSVLGNYGTGIPSVIGLYFNVFTALIQTIIFITLALSCINEATTAVEY
ncbi:MAG: F0F1 ATP synthase subunit A [Lachnospiraceae bacterium]